MPSKIRLVFILPTKIFQFLNQLTEVSMRNLTCVSRISFYHYSTAAPQQQFRSKKVLNPKRWRIEVALMVYRLPVIAPPMTDVQREFIELSEQLDFSQSYKNDFELLMEKDARLMEKRKKFEAEGKDLSELDEQLGVTSFQHLDEWKQRAERLAGTYHFDDPQKSIDSGPEYSLSRDLDKKLVLAVRKRFPDSPSADYISPWTIPTAVNGDGETLKQTVERCLKLVNSKTKHPNEPKPYGFRIMGNAPIGHLMQKFPKPMKERLQLDGAILFFYPIQLYRTAAGAFASSDVDFDKNEIVEHRWCTKRDFEGFVKLHHYNAKIPRIIFLE